jgi:hypothetical protein
MIHNPPSISGSPPIYWIIPDSIIPNTAKIEQRDSDSGDVCHYNIFEWPKRDQRQAFKKFGLKDFKICLNGADGRPLTATDIENNVCI